MKKILILGCIIVGVFSYIGYNIANTTDVQTPTQTKSIHVSVESGYSSLRITSNQDIDVHGLNIYIHGYPELGGYKCDSTYLLQSHKQLIVNLSDFYKDNGERFDYDKFKVMEIWIGSFSDNYNFQKFGN